MMGDGRSGQRAIGSFRSSVMALLFSGFTLAMLLTMHTSAAADGCTFQGFNLRQKQLPRGLKSSRAVTLYTLALLPASQVEAPDPQAARASLAATAAACIARSNCVMFTSDGALIGAYRAPLVKEDVNAGVAEDQHKGQALEWVPMDYCAGACCGTWAANNLEQLLMTPVTNRDSLPRVNFSTLPRDVVSDIFSDHYRTMKPKVMARLCGGLQASNSPAATISMPPGMNKSTHNGKQAASSLRCPPRCHLACCARYAAGEHEFDWRYAFEQCTANACALRCTVPPDQAPIGELALPARARPAAFGAYSHIKVEYLRAASLQQPPGGSIGSQGRRDNSSGLQ